MLRQPKRRSPSAIGGLLLALALSLPACSDDDSSSPCNNNNCPDACQPDCTGRCEGADDGCGGSCPTTDCADGCCALNGQCVVSGGQSDLVCGAGGQACSDCIADARSDQCEAGVCLCAATGAPCDPGTWCSASGCGTCAPSCVGRCASADDGCGGQCPSTDCPGGCCDALAQCVPFASQGDAACGPAGEACVDCGIWGHACDTAQHACLSPLTQDARFVSQTVPAVMTPGQTAAVTVTMQNLGTADWTAADAYRLGAQNPQDNSLWGMSRVDLAGGDTIAAGQSKTFSFQVTAPAAPGIHRFGWRMLQESVTWFGAYSRFVPVLVSDGSETVVVCEAARNLAGTATNAAPVIQGCIDATASGEILELPAGVYQLDSHLSVAAAAITLRTESTDLTQPPCALTNHGCAELRASTAFYDTGGILQVSAAGAVVDHLVISGNKTARATTPAGLECGAYNNAYGYNLRLLCSQCALTNSVTRDALCGTGCEVTGVGTDVILWRNAVVDNGVHNLEGLWADGVTVHDHAHATFTENYFLDNTDVDFIFGGCQDCIIQDNLLEHSAAFSGSSFAALMLHAWPSTSGNFTGTDTSGNVVDCGPDRRCGIGLYLGSDAWYITDVFGGAVHHNRVANAEQGLLLDDAHDLAVYTNPVANPAATTAASCGTVVTSAYAQGTTTHNVSSSRDTLSVSYASVDFDGCIPNWWH